MSAARVGLRCLSRCFQQGIRAQGCSSAGMAPAARRPNALIGSSVLIRSVHTTPSLATEFINGDEDMEEVLKSPTPVVVDFFAHWCGPCKLLTPRLRKAVDARDGKVILVKANIDDVADIAMRYNVAVVPTVVGIANGEEKIRFEGNIENTELEAFLDELTLK